MQRFLPALVLAAALLAASAGSPSAQTGSADVTLVSVLTMAKDEAESVPQASRAHLRARVALAMMITGQQAAFGSYVPDALAAYRPDEELTPGANEIDKINFEIEQSARRAFLAGDPMEAARTLQRCRMDTWPSPRCGGGEFSFGRDADLQFRFLRWEIRAERYDAALHRLGTAEWPAHVWQIILLINGPLIAAGDAERTKEIQRLLGKSGIEHKDCIVKAWSLYIGNGKEPKEPGRGAILRRLACEGNGQAAVAMAQAQTQAVMRLSALMIVAEGLAGLPGMPDEPLLLP